MAYDPERHQRRSFRLAGYDYSQEGIYFVTICVHGRRCALGSIRDGTIAPNEYGEIVAQCWLALPKHYLMILLDAWVIMPNHLHGIIMLTNGPSGTTQPSLGTIVGSFKSAATRQINKRRETPQVFWQRGYFEHIVRNEQSLDRLRRYIAENPARWAQDQLHPNASPPR